MANKFNISNPKKWTDKNGEEKTNWANVGVLTQFDNGNMIVEMNDRSEVYQVFPFKDSKVVKKENSAEDTIKEFPQEEQQGEEVKIENIPF